MVEKAPRFVLRGFLSIISIKKRYAGLIFECDDSDGRGFWNRKMPIALGRGEIHQG